MNFVFKELGFFVPVLVESEQCFFEEVRTMLLAMNCDRPNVYAFVKLAFKLAEERRPKMIEMRRDA